MITKKLQPPYYAVIFSSKRTDVEHGYGEMAGRMVELAAQQPGYLGIESYRNADGNGVTISYWESLDAIRHWKRNLEHREAQERGREEWYSAYRTRVARVEYEYGFEAEEQVEVRREGRNE